MATQYPHKNKGLYWITDLLFLAVTLGLFYAAWIGSHALFTPDEGRYSEVAREMVASHDYITPRLDGVAFLDKPALYYWLQASAIHLFGLKEWALRFWPALMGVLGSLVTYAAGHVLFNRRTGILSALIVATSPLYYGAAHYANLDLEVAVLIGNALLFFIMAMQFPDKTKLRSFLLILAYVFSGFAALTKGLIGIAFPMLIIGCWILTLNRWYILKKMHIVLGIFIFAAITVPWYVLVQKANPEFLHFFFVTQQFSRFLTKGDFNNKAAIWFYVPVILIGVFPWTIFVFQALAQHIKNVWQNRKQYANTLFLLIWFVIVFIFFSIPKSKTVGYILPLFPALALLVGNYLDNLWQQTNSKSLSRSLIALMIFCGVTALGFVAAPHIKGLHISSMLSPHLYLLGGILFCALITSCLLLRKKNMATIFVSLLALSVVFLMALIASTGALNDRSVKPLAEALNAQLKPDDEIVTYYKFYYDLPIYTGRRITIVADWSASDIPTNDNWVRELWYGMPFQNTSSWLINEDTFWKRWSEDKRLFVVTDSNRLHDLESNAKGRVYSIAQYRNMVLLSNKPA